MPNDYVDMAADMTASDLNGTNDVTQHFYSAIMDCLNSGGTKKIVKMPGESGAAVSLRISTQQSLVQQRLYPNTFKDSHGNFDPTTGVISKGVQKWMGHRQNTQIWLDNVDRGSDGKSGQWANAVVTLFAWDGIAEGSLEFLLDGRSKDQMGGVLRNGRTGGPAGTGNWESGGNLIGYACHGLKSTNAVHPDIALTVINTRTVNTNGHAAQPGDPGYPWPKRGSAFAIEMIQPKGGTYWCEFGTPDGQIGSECIVFHGASFVNGWASNPWTITHLRSSLMLRGWGCFNGGTGDIHDMVTHDLLKVANASSHGYPSGYMGAHQSNIEAGKDKGSNGGTPGPINIWAPQSTNAIECVTNANNDGNVVGEVHVYGLDPSSYGTGVRGFSRNDQRGLHFAQNDADTVGVFFHDFQFDNPSGVCVDGNLAQGQCVAMTNCKYTSGTTRTSGGADPTNGRNPDPAHAGHGGVAWDLTSGTFGNSRPSITAFTPADHANIPPTTPITISVTASDIEDTA